MKENRIAVDLESILESREKRLQKQRHLLNIYQSTLVSYMVNMPSMYKSTPLSSGIHNAGHQALVGLLERMQIRILKMRIDDEPTGREGYYVLEASAGTVKEMLVSLEETHPLGRLWDMDVFDAAGNQMSRVSLGLGERKCLICDSDARSCARSRRHPYEELLEKVEGIYRKYQNPIDFKAGSFEIHDNQIGGNINEKSYQKINTGNGIAACSKLDADRMR